MHKEYGILESRTGIEFWSKGGGGVFFSIDAKTGRDLRLGERGSTV